VRIKAGESPEKKGEEATKITAVSSDGASKRVTIGKNTQSKDLSGGPNGKLECSQR